jgi:hypothetical protein
MRLCKKCAAITACALLFCTLLPLTVFGHSGRTDSRGGHYDHQMGMYHYHHGFPAHGHPDGVCPFDSNYEENLEKTAGMDYTDAWYEEETQEESSAKSVWHPVTEASNKPFAGRKFVAGLLILLSLGIFGIVLYRLMKSPRRVGTHHRLGSSFFILLLPVSVIIVAVIIALIIWCFR